MTILFMESGTDATSGLEFYTSVSGTVSSSGAQSKTGPRSILMSGTSATVNPQVFSGITAGRLSCYARFSAVDFTAASALFGLFGPGIFAIGLGTSGSVFRVYDDDVANVRATGTTVLNAGQWYHLAIAFSRTSSSVNRFKMWIDGVLEFDLTDVTWTSSFNSLSMRYLGGGAASVHYDDVYADDVSDLTFPGDIRVTAKLPVALNTNNFDTLGGTGTNRYDRVSERAINVNNYIQHAGTSDVQENFGIQAAAVGDVDISDAYIVGYRGWVYAKRGDFDTRYVRTIGQVNSKT